jgi:hypothetical protein
MTGFCSMEKSCLNCSVLFLGKKNDEYCKKAFEFVKRNFKTVEVYLSK